MFGWFTVKLVLLYYEFARDVRDGTYRVTERTKTHS